MPTSTLFALALVCYLLAGHPSLIVAQLALIVGPLLALVALVRLLSPRLEVRP